MTITKKHFNATMLALFIGIFLAACSVSETEQAKNYDSLEFATDDYSDEDSTLVTDEELEAYSLAAAGLDERPSPMVRSSMPKDLTETLYRDGINTKHDWRNIKITEIAPYHKQILSKWLTESGAKRRFHYITVNGDKYWVNLTFFSHRPDVWYSVVEEKYKKVLQTGWTTVNMAQRYVYSYAACYNQHRSVLIELDVDFHPSLKMKRGIILSEYYKQYRGQLYNPLGYFPKDNEFKFNDIHKRGDFAFQSKYMEGDPFKNHTVIYRDAVNPKHDWRTQVGTGKAVTDRNIYQWIFNEANKIRFHYITVGGEKIWMNFTFFTHRPDVWYQVVGEKLGPIQTGWSTVRLNQVKLTRNLFNPNAIFVDFDVEFDKSTHLSSNDKYLAVTRSLGIIAGIASVSGEHRGEWASRNDSQFKFKEKTFPSVIKYGNFEFLNGHLIR